MFLRTRSGYKAPVVINDGLLAYGVQDTIGSATPAPPSGVEAKGKQDTLGTAAPLLVRPGLQDTTGRANPRVAARGIQDTVGSATSGGTSDTSSVIYFRLPAYTDLANATITDYVVRVHETGNYLKQAPAGLITHPQAYDFFVQTAAGVNLDHFIEFYDGVNGIIDVAFRIPSYVTNSPYDYRFKLGSRT